MSSLLLLFTLLKILCFISYLVLDEELEKAKPENTPTDDAFGEKKHKAIKVISHRVENGQAGEEGKDKLFVSVLYARTTSLVSVSEFVKAPDMLRDYMNAKLRQVAKTIYLEMEGTGRATVKLNPTIKEKLDEAELVTTPKYILIDGETGI